MSKCASTLRIFAGAGRAAGSFPDFPRIAYRLAGYVKGAEKRPNPSWSSGACLPHPSDEEGGLGLGILGMLCGNAGFPHMKSIARAPAGEALRPSLHHEKAADEASAAFACALRLRLAHGTVTEQPAHVRLARSVRPHPAASEGAEGIPVPVPEPVEAARPAEPDIGAGWPAWEQQHVLPLWPQNGKPSANSSASVSKSSSSPGSENCIDRSFSEGAGSLQSTSSGSLDKSPSLIRKSPPVSPFRSRSGSNRMLPYGPENGRCFSCSPMSLPACISPSLPYQTALFSEAGRTRSSGVNSRMGRRYSPRAPLAPMEKQSRPWRKNFVRYVFAGWMYA